jgi:hypothetical protein
MLKHFVLNLNPHAQFEWERCTLHHPITANQPNLAHLIATTIDHAGQATESGSYLVAINIEVTVLEQAQIEPATACRLLGKVELPTIALAA